MIAIPKRIVPHSPENVVRSPALVKQLMTRCSSDGTFFCRCHSTRNSTVSEAAFPTSKKGINNADGKRDVSVIEMIPAEQVIGNAIDKIISNIVARQLRLSEERNMRVKTRTAIATAVTQRGHSSTVKTLSNASFLVFPVI